MASVAIGAIRLNGQSAAADKILEAISANNGAAQTQRTFFARLRVDQQAGTNERSILFDDGSGTAAAYVRLNLRGGSNHVRWELQDNAGGVIQVDSINDMSGYVGDGSAGSGSQIAVALVQDMRSGREVDAFEVGSAVSSGANDSVSQSGNYTFGTVAYDGQMTLRAENGDNDLLIAELAIFGGQLSAAQIDELATKTAENLTDSPTVEFHFLATKTSGPIASGDASMTNRAGGSEFSNLDPDNATGMIEYADFGLTLDSTYESEDPPADSYDGEIGMVEVLGPVTVAVSGFGTGTNPTVTTQSEHGLEVGDYVRFSGLDVAMEDDSDSGDAIDVNEATFRVASVPSTTTFTIETAGEQTVNVSSVTDGVGTLFVGGSTNRNGKRLRTVVGLPVTATEDANNRPELTVSSPGFAGDGSETTIPRTLKAKLVSLTADGDVIDEDSALITDWMHDQLTAQDAGVLFIADSTGTLGYAAPNSNGSLYYALVSQLPNVRGFQLPMNNVTTTARDHYDLKLDNNPTLTAGGIVSHQRLADPGNENAAYTGGATGFMFTDAEHMAFSGSVGVTDNFYTWEAFDSPDIPGGTWWEDEPTAEVVIPFYHESGYTLGGDALRVNTQRGSLYSIDYDFSNDSVDFNPNSLDPAKIYVPEHVTGDGVKFIRQQISPTASSTGADVKARLFGAGGSYDQTGEALIVGAPMLRVPPATATGLDVWCAGFSGWGMEEFLLEGPGGLNDRHVKDAAWRSLFDAAANELGRPITMTITAIGSNSNRLNATTYIQNDLGPAVLRIARLAIPYTTDGKFGWLHWTPAEITDGETYRDIDTQIRNYIEGKPSDFDAIEGFAEAVPRERVSLISYASEINYEEYGAVGTTHENDTIDGVHPLPVGANNNAAFFVSYAAQTPAAPFRSIALLDLILDPDDPNGSGYIYNDDEVTIQVPAAWLSDSKDDSVAVAALTDVVNHSELEYPKPIVSLLTPPYQNVNGELNVDVYAVGMYGIARVESTLTDAAANEETRNHLIEMISGGSFAGAASSQVPVYRATYDAADFSKGVVDFPVRVYPRIGVASTVYDFATENTVPNAAHTKAFFDVDQTDARICYADPRETCSVTEVTGTPEVGEYLKGLGFNGYARLDAITDDAVWFTPLYSRTYSIPVTELSGTPQVGDFIQVGNSFRFPTNEPSGVIEALADNGSGLIRVTSTNHGLTTSDMVNIKDTRAAGGDPSVMDNGYSVTVIDADTFDLDLSTFVTVATAAGASLGHWEKTGNPSRTEWSGRVIEVGSGTVVAEIWDHGGSLPISDGDRWLTFDPDGDPPTHQDAGVGDVSANATQWGKGAVTAYGVVSGTPTQNGDTGSTGERQSFTITDGDQFEGTTSEAVITLGGAATPMGNDATAVVADAANPAATIRGSIAVLQAARGDAKADQGTVYLQPGHYLHGGEADATLATEDTSVVIQPAPGVLRNQVHIRRSSQSVDGFTSTGNGDVGLGVSKVHYKDVTFHYDIQGTNRHPIEESADDGWFIFERVDFIGNCGQSDLFTEPLASNTGGLWQIDCKNTHYFRSHTGYRQLNTTAVDITPKPSVWVNCRMEWIGADVWRNPCSVINCLSLGSGAEGTSVHSDTAQFFTNENAPISNILYALCRVKGHVRGQPFIFSGREEIDHDGLALICCVHDDNMDPSLTNAGQIEAGKMNNLLVWNCHFGDTGPSFTQDFGERFYSNISFRNNLLKGFGQSQGTKFAGMFHLNALQSALDSELDDGTNESFTLANEFSTITNPDDIDSVDYMRPDIPSGLPAHTAESILPGLGMYTLDGVEYSADDPIGPLTTDDSVTTLSNLSLSVNAAGDGFDFSFDASGRLGTEDSDFLAQLTAPLGFPNIEITRSDLSEVDNGNGTHTYSGSVITEPTLGTWTFRVNIFFDIDGNVNFTIYVEQLEVELNPPGTPAITGGPTADAIEISRTPIIKVTPSDTLASTVQVVAVAAGVSSDPDADTILASGTALADQDNEVDVQMNELPSGTEVDVFARASNANGDSDWSTKLTFTTTESTVSTGTGGSKRIYISRTFRRNRNGL